MSNLRLTVGTNDRKNTVSLNPDFQGIKNGNSIVFVQKPHTGSKQPTVLLRVQKTDSYEEYDGTYRIGSKQITRTGEVEISAEDTMFLAKKLFESRDFSLSSDEGIPIIKSLLSAIERNDRETNQ